MSVTRLNVSNNYIESDGAVAIAKVIPRNKVCLPVRDLVGVVGPFVARVQRPSGLAQTCYWGRRFHHQCSLADTCIEEE